ncbi:MAG: RDD family protein [Pseudomonadota bacterium]
MSAVPRRVEILPPEGVAIAFEVAPLGARFGAQIIDLIVTGIATGLFLVLVASTGWVSEGALMGVGAMAFFFARIPYYIAAEIAMNGRTPGKRMLGLRVIAQEGGTLTPHAVTLRNLMKEIEVFTPGTLILIAATLSTTTLLILLAWVAILLAVPLFNRRRQRLGDLAAGTLVVTTPRPKLLPDLAEPRPQSPQFAFAVHHLEHYGRYELQTLEDILQVDRTRLTQAASRQHSQTMGRVRDAIVRRTGYEGLVREAETPAFLQSFYRNQRAFLENRKLFGEDREDKNHASPPPPG